MDEMVGCPWEDDRLMKWLWFKIRWLFTRKKRKGKDFIVAKTGVGAYRVDFNPDADFPVRGTVAPDAFPPDEPMSLERLDELIDACELKTDWENVFYSGDCKCGHSIRHHYMGIYYCLMAGCDCTKAGPNP